MLGYLLYVFVSVLGEVGDERRKIGYVCILSYYCAAVTAGFSFFEFAFGEVGGEMGCFQLDSSRCKWSGLGWTGLDWTGRGVRFMDDELVGWLGIRCQDDE